MFARTNAIGAVLVVSTVLSPVTCVSAFASAPDAPSRFWNAGPDGTAALSVFTGQGDDGRGWVGNADGEGGPSNVPAPAERGHFAQAEGPSSGRTGDRREFARRA